MEGSVPSDGSADSLSDGDATKLLGEESDDETSESEAGCEQFVTTRVRSTRCLSVHGEKGGGGVPQGSQVLSFPVWGPVTGSRLQRAIISNFLCIRIMDSKVKNITSCPGQGNKTGVIPPTPTPAGQESE